MKFENHLNSNYRRDNSSRNRHGHLRLITVNYGELRLFTVFEGGGGEGGSEIPKPEGRNPNSDREPISMNKPRGMSSPISEFGFRISFGFRPSDFGFRGCQLRSRLNAPNTAGSILALPRSAAVPPRPAAAASPGEAYGTQCHTTPSGRPAPKAFGGLSDTAALRPVFVWEQCQDAPQQPRLAP